MEVADFSGYVTRYGLRCTDGRTILAHAFKADDNLQVPLVWQHQHNSPDNVLGHLKLQHRDDGVYGRAFFNDTEMGQKAKALVHHKDINALSIFATQLAQTGANVTHGSIKEGSLVLAGANPGAYIDNVTIAHADGVPQIVPDQAVIYGGFELVEGDGPVRHDVGGVSGLAPAATTITAGVPKPALPSLQTAPPAPVVHADGATVNDIFDSFTEDQKTIVHSMIGAAIEQASAGNLSHQEGDPQVRNVFDQSGGGTATAVRTIQNTLSHEDVRGIIADAMRCGSLKEALGNYDVLKHGIDNIELLFPTEQSLTTTPEFISRRNEWVAGVLGKVHRTPFSRIKTLTADITFDEARARGYIKGSVKKEEFFEVARRITTPTTFYKKQKLDRDDVIDITDFDVIQWIQTEMRIMLDEELARAILIGDGRDVDDEDRINPANLRPILTDDELYVTTVNLDLVDASSSDDEIVDGVIKSMRFYRGSGTPVLYTTLIYLARLLTVKDTQGHRLYSSKADLAVAMGVSDIIPVEPMESVAGLIGIIVNLTDYNIGADRGGQVSMFDQFDIDFNQMKYLLEARCSGALTKFRSALVLQEFSGAGGMLLDPTSPTFDHRTGIVTIPTMSHVDYVTVADDGTESSSLSSGAQTAIAPAAKVHVRAKAADTYSFPTNGTDDWTFRRDRS